MKDFLKKYENVPAREGDALGVLLVGVDHAEGLGHVAAWVGHDGEGERVQLVVRLDVLDPAYIFSMDKHTQISFPKFGAHLTDSLISTLVRFRDQPFSGRQLSCIYEQMK